MCKAPFLTDEFFKELTLECPNYDFIRTKIIDAYNTTTNSNLDVNLPKDSADLLKVVSWLGNLECSEIETGFILKLPKLRRIFSDCISSKINFLGQQYCNQCKLDFPISTIPIRITPKSHQASKPKIKQAFKQAIKSRLVNSHNYLDARVCISILVICGKKSQSGDLDNIAKLLLDSMKGVIFNDDEQIDHLNIMRINDNSNEDYIIIHVGKSHLNEHQDVLYAGTNHSWAGQEPINLENYLKT